MDVGALAVPEFQRPSAAVPDTDDDKECSKPMFTETLHIWTMSKHRYEGSPKLLVGGSNRGGTTAIARGISYVTSFSLGIADYTPMYRDECYVGGCDAQLI